MPNTENNPENSEHEHPMRTADAVLEREPTVVFQRPTIGRIVHFTESGADLAAIIVNVNDDETINLLVFSKEGAMFPRTNRRLGPNEQQWRWPARL